MGRFLLLYAQREDNKTMTERTISMICFTKAGKDLAGRLRLALETEGLTADVTDGRGCLKEWVRARFEDPVKQVLVFIGAAGIAVRAIAPYIRDKFSDPAVIVIDEKGQYVIPILSGHVGEANRYANLLSGFCGGTAVITTATDVNGLFAVDVFAEANDLIIGDRAAAKRFSAELLSNGKAVIRIDERIREQVRVSGTIPAELSLADSKGQSDEVTISPFTESRETELTLIPRMLVLGIGCRKDKDPGELSRFVSDFLEENMLDPHAVASIATIDLKKNEPALINLADQFDVPLLVYSAEELASVDGEFTASAFVQQMTGVDNICERACMAAGCERLLIRKTARDGMTAAAGLLPVTLAF